MVSVVGGNALDGERDSVPLDTANRYTFRSPELSQETPSSRGLSLSSCFMASAPRCRLSLPPQQRSYPKASTRLVARARLYPARLGMPGVFSGPRMWTVLLHQRGTPCTLKKLQPSLTLDAYVCGCASRPSSRPARLSRVILNENKLLNTKLRNR